MCLHWNTACWAFLGNWDISCSRHKKVFVSTLSVSCCLRQVSLTILGYKLGLHLGFLAVFQCLFSRAIINVLVQQCCWDLRLASKTSLLMKGKPCSLPALCAWDLYTLELPVGRAKPGGGFLMAQLSCHCQGVVQSCRTSQSTVGKHPFVYICWDKRITSFSFLGSSGELPQE